MSLIVWMSEPLARALGKRLSIEATVVSSAQQFLDAPRNAKTISFLDDTTIAALDRLGLDLSASTGQPSPQWRKLVSAVSIGPIVAICNERLPTAIGWLPSHLWLSHIISATLLEQTIAKEHLANLIATLTSGEPKLLDWLGRKVTGRRIRLSHASKCAERLERMSEFFDSQGVTAPTVRMLRDAAQELLTNAFYDAPVAAGALASLSRTQDVALPDESACDMAYGCRDDLALVRVRDPFGSLSRERLVEVLTRYSADANATGPGRGLWGVCSVASLVAVSVVSNGHTEMLVGIGKQDTQPRPSALHLFFRKGAKRRFWTMLDEDTGNPTLANSVTIVVK